MARTAAPDPASPPTGRFAQFRAVFTMTRRADPSLIWWMLAALVGTTGLGVAIGWWLDHPIYVGILGLMFGLLLAVAILGRKAERAAFTQIADQKGAAGYALKGLRRGWNVEEQPVAVDPRTQDLLFRAVGRPGVLLVTEGPLPRVKKLAETERKRLARILPDVPVIVLHAGDGADQVPLRKPTRTVLRQSPTLTKEEVSQVAKRLRALSAVRPPIPQGIDPQRMRPDRRATRGR